MFERQREVSTFGCLVICGFIFRKYQKNYDSKRKKKMLLTSVF
jgi:hypothetical protein